MALKICRQVGQQFKVGKALLTLAEVKGPECFVLERPGALKQRWTIDTKPFEILPGVRISAGKSDRPYRAWITIDAPKDVRIERVPVETDEFS
jgi:hypothetical protein